MEEKGYNELHLKKGKAIFSIGVKIALLVTIILAAVVITGLWTVLPSYTNRVKSDAEGNLYNMALAYGMLMDEVLKSNDENDLDPKTAKELLKEAKIDKVDSSYAYYVSADGIMLYHPTEEKIGEEVENAVVKGIVQELRNGNVPKPAFMSYEFNGAMKYASYHISDINHNILVITADEEDILKELNAFKNDLIFKVILFCIFGILFTVLYAIMMIRSLKQLTVIVQNTAMLNFDKNLNIDKLCNKRDETGDIARAIYTMRENLQGIVGNLDDQTQALYEQSKVLMNSANDVNDQSMKNSETLQTLSAAMEENSSATETMLMNIGNIQNNVEDISDLATNGESIAVEIMGRANELKIKTDQATEETKRIYQNIKSKTEVAIEQAKAVDRIHVLTDAIRGIADQTSLLALNASIEAARAGEAGKGFAVVANEIRDLASQSEQTVDEIGEIVKEVNVAVENMTDGLQKTSEFLDSTVIEDYENFSQVSDNYNMDAMNFDDSMKSVGQAIHMMKETISNLLDAVEGISITLNESVTGVSDVAYNTANIVSLTAETKQLVDKSFDNTQALHDIVRRFKL